MSKRGQDTEWDASHGMEEIREFFFKEFAALCLFWNFFVLWSSNNITYHSKARYAYCDSPVSVFLLFVSFSYIIEGKASIYEERLLIV